MAEIIARFADGRLLVQEERVIDTDAYTSGMGVPVRVGLVKTVEKVVSLDSYVSGYPECRVGAPLADAVASGDTILVRLRRQDFLSGMISGFETAAGSRLSGITSGLKWNEELASGLPISGQLKVRANVIGF